MRAMKMTLASHFGHNILCCCGCENASHSRPFDLREMYVKLEKLQEISGCSNHAGLACQNQFFTGEWSILCSMISDDLQILSEHPHCLTVLKAYADWENASENLTETAWRERFCEQSGEESTEEEPSWSAAHGLLIAYGLIDIELAGRSTGFHYRISSEGKRALARFEGHTLEMTDTEEFSADDAADADQLDDLAA